MSVVMTCVEMVESYSVFRVVELAAVNYGEGVNKVLYIMLYSIRATSTLLTSHSPTHSAQQEHTTIQRQTFCFKY